MSLPATDNFDRATGSLGSNWTYGPTGSDATTLLVSVTNQGVVRGGADVAAYWNADAFADNQYSKKTVVSGMIANTNYDAVLARCSGSGATFQGYQFTSDGTSGAGHCVLQRWNAGSLVDLAAVATTFTAADVMEIRVSGTNPVTIEAYKNTVLVGSFSDSSGSRISSGGAPGIGGFATAGDAVFDDWEGGNLSSSPVSDVIAPRRYSTHFLF